MFVRRLPLLHIFLSKTSIDRQRDVLLPELRRRAVEADEEEAVGDDLHGAEHVGRGHRLGIAGKVPAAVLGGRRAPGHYPAHFSGPVDED